MTIEELQQELTQVKKKSSIRKRHLRDLNKKIELYVALADAAISDAARWKLEYQKVKEELDGLKSNQD